MYTADEMGKDDVLTQRTLLIWYSMFKKYGGFEEGSRGNWVRISPIALFPSIRRRSTLMTRNTKWVTLERTRIFVNAKLKRITDKEGEEGMHMRNFIQERGINMV